MMTDKTKTALLQMCKEAEKAQKGDKEILTMLIGYQRALLDNDLISDEENTLLLEPKIEEIRKKVTNTISGLSKQYIDRLREIEQNEQK